MTPERWLQTCEILDAALELEPEEASAFIEERCADDDDLKTYVKSLYASLRKRGMSFDLPAPEIVAQDIAQRSQQPLLKVGQCLKERYEICDQLGEGGFAQVYKAKDKRLGRYVAIKIFSPTPENKSDDALGRFRDEALAVSSLGHPNIVTVFDIEKHDIEEEGDTPFIVTEFIDGITLRQRMKRSQIKLPEALNIAIQLTLALIPVHKNRIVHRDIKPENIMLGTDNFVKIFDFGVAKLTRKEILASESKEHEREDTKSGAIIGSNKYMSPEQLQGRRDVDGRSDLWAVGVVLYEMIAGRVPFDGPNRDVVSHRILSNEKPEPLSKYSSIVTPELSRLISKALSKDREKRYETAHAMLLDLEKLRAIFERDKAKRDLKTVFLNFISRAYRGLGMLFKSKDLEAAAAGNDGEEFVKGAPAKEDSEITLVKRRVRHWLSLGPSVKAGWPRTPRAANALKWGKAHPEALAGGVAVLLVLIIVGLTFFNSGRIKPPSSDNRIAGGNIGNTDSNNSAVNTNSPQPGLDNTNGLDINSNTLADGSKNPKPPGKGATKLVSKRNLKEHRGVALAVAFSPNGKLAASGSEDGVRLWDTSSWESKLLQSPLEEHNNIATSIAFSHDSEMVASSSNDKTILLWNKEDEYYNPKSLLGHTDAVNVVSFSPTEKLLASGGKDKSVILWDLQAGRQYPLAHNDEVLAVAISHDGKTLASASKDGTIRIWNLLRRGEFKELCTKCGQIYALAFSCDDKILMSGGADNKIKRWNWQEEKVLEPIWEQPYRRLSKNNFITSLAFSPDCTSLATASGDGTVRIWNLDTGKARVLGQHGQRVNWISFSRDWMLISGSHDRTVKIWQLTGG